MRSQMTLEVDIVHSKNLVRSPAQLDELTRLFEESLTRALALQDPLLSVRVERSNSWIEHSGPELVVPA